MNIEIYDRDSFFLHILMEYMDCKEIYINTETISPSGNNDKDEEKSTKKSFLPKKPVSDPPPCFICDYIQLKKQPKILSVSQNIESLKAYAEDSKKNKYTMLEALVKAYSDHVIDKDCFDRLFSGLTKEKNFSAAADWEQIVRGYKYRFLFGDIDDFFYNRGYNATKGQKRDESKKKADGYIDELNLLCKYFTFCRENNKETAFLSDSVTIDETYIQQCTELLNDLTESGNDEIFVPLYFDSRLGAGVFIVGTSYSDDFKNIGSCCVAVLGQFNAVNYVDYGRPLEIELAYTQCSTVSEAFDKLNDGITKGLFYDDYKATNNIVNPEKLNSVFQPFFDFDTTRKISQKEQDMKNISKDYSDLSRELLW